MSLCNNMSIYRYTSSPQVDRTWNCLICIYIDGVCTCEKASRVASSTSDSTGDGYAYRKKAGEESGLRV